MMILIISHQAHDLTLRKTLIRYFFCENLPDNDSKAINVSFLINFILVPNDLRSHPLVCPHPFVFLLLLLLPSQSKITQLDHIPLVPNEHIRTLQIPVQYLFHVMKIHHSLDSLIHYLYLFELSELLMLLMQLVKKTTILHILRHQNELVCCYTDTHVQHYVRMLQV